MTEPERKKRMRNSLFWRLWLRALTVKRPQAGVAIGSLLVGAATMSLLVNLYSGVRRKMTQEFRAYGANVVLAPGSGSSSPGLMDEQVMSPLEAFKQRAPGVVVVPRLDVVARIRRAPGEPQVPESMNAVVVGTDFGGLLRLNPGWRLLNSTQTLEPGSCAVGEHVAALLHLEVGSVIRVEPVGQFAELSLASEGSPRRSKSAAMRSGRESVQGSDPARRALTPLLGKEGARGWLQVPEREPTPQPFRISTVVSSGASEDDQIFLPLAALQGLTGLGGGAALGPRLGQHPKGDSVGGKISLVELSVPGEPAEVERWVGELSRAFASPSAGAPESVEVRPVREIVSSEGTVLVTIHGLVIWLTSLIMGIIALCVMATTIAIVLERRKDIAVMKALGASDRLVMRLFLAEGAGLGLLGGLAGVLVGALLAHELGRRLFGVSLAPAWWTLPLLCLASMVLSVLAAVFPVRIVRGVRPAVALKGE